MSVEHVPVTDVKVYQLNVCEALGDHEKCLGLDTLCVGLHEIGAVVCNCRCHGKIESQPN